MAKIRGYCLDNTEPIASDYTFRKSITEIATYNDDGPEPTESLYAVPADRKDIPSSFPTLAPAGKAVSGAASLMSQAWFGFGFAGLLAFLFALSSVRNLAL